MKQSALSARSIAEHATPAESTSPRWVVLGGGRVGRGFLTFIANKLDLSTTLVVAGEQTPPPLVDDYNNLNSNGAGYRVRIGDSEHQLNNYRFHTVLDTDAIVSDVASPYTEILSSSVGLSRLEQLLPVVVRGLSLRKAGQPLTILICENGRLPNGLTPAAHFLNRLEMLGGRKLTASVDVVSGVVDCTIPMLPQKADQVLLCGPGHLYTDNSLRGDHRLRKFSEYVRFCDDMKALHTLKLYCHNTLHCLLSVFGHFLGKKHVDEVARQDELLLTTISASLASAVKQECSLETRQELAGRTVDEFANVALLNLRTAIGTAFDSVNRALSKLCDGSYFCDGRLAGPLLALGLCDDPSNEQHRQLIHAVSLALYLYVRNIQYARDSLPFLGVPSYLRDGGPVATLDLIRVGTFDGSLLDPKRVSQPIMEVFARDCLELERSVNHRAWTTAQLADFLDRPIQKKLKVVPKFVPPSQIRCVVFDMDEGLVATESLLYQVTRELILEHSEKKVDLKQDEYAEHVGQSEVDFFAQMIRRHNLRDTDAETLVQEREKRYSERLEKANAGDLVKPGFQRMLDGLADKGVTLCIYSNASSSRMRITLDRAELLSYFQRLVSATDKGMAAKPDPKMLEAILDQYNLTPDNCLVVESSLVGVDAAVSAGCFCILLVHDFTSPDPEQIERKGVEVLESSQRLLRWFERYVLLDTGRRTGRGRRTTFSGTLPLGS
jgi:HAD superfamily hydrolase (TIGR01509 family)